MFIQMTNDMKARPSDIGSVEEALAVRRAAETRNAVCGAVLALELVVVGELFVCEAVSMYSSRPGVYSTNSLFKMSFSA